MSHLTHGVVEMMWMFGLPHGKSSEKNTKYRTGIPTYQCGGVTGVQVLSSPTKIVLRTLMIHCDRPDQPSDPVYSSFGLRKEICRQPSTYSKQQVQCDIALPSSPLQPAPSHHIFLSPRRAVTMTPNALWHPRIEPPGKRQMHVEDFPNRSTQPLIP
jgi:hypothetical protein